MAYRLIKRSPKDGVLNTSSDVKKKKKKRVRAAGISTGVVALLAVGAYFLFGKKSN